MTIGIPGWLTGPNSFGVAVNYLSWLREIFNHPDIIVIFPETPIIPDLDLLLLTGGADINPMRYGEMPGYNTDKSDNFKEYFDSIQLPEYIRLNVPIFGICRGIQSIAVHFGAHLFQDMWHETNTQEDPYSAVHKLSIAGLPAKKVEVNSRHHQCVKMPEGESQIEVLATHFKYPMHIEAIRIKDKPIYAIQWHPEDLNNELGIKYTLHLLNQCLTYKKDDTKTDNKE
jgi:putative glutamine amidotransferase